ncbi:BRCT domain-containing protein [Syncephalis plumigaleata]|nr:BRCT domain-containing protein [Syncephalis plumigaleata]
MTAFTDNLASDNILVADKQDDTAMDTSVQLDNNTATTTSAAVDYSSYDPMLISELDDPPHTSPPTTTTTTAEPVQRVLPVKTYGHSKEIASHSRKTHVKSDTTRVPVFKGVFYWINPLMTRPLRDELHKLLQTNGGIDTSHKHLHASTNIEEEEEDRLFNTQFSLTRTTHCISWDYDFPEYEEVIARDIHIVTPTWVQRAIRNGYTHRPEYYLPDADHFLSGIVVTTSQIPDMDRDAIFGGVEAFGGQWQERMVKEVTHLVALTPGGPRYESAMQHPELGIKVVLPHWLDDCFRLRRRIPEHQYLFPNPPLLQHHPWLSVSSEVNTPLNSNTETTETTAIDHLNNTSPSDPQCLLGYRIYLADDLKLADETVTLLEKRINEAGGQLCKEYTSDQVDIVICRWRTSRAYQQAIMSNKIVGTLNWLFHLLITHRLESSTNQLLHYPPPKHGMPDMRHFIITISNYSGMAREYLKRLIILCGAQYTAEMTRRNTHVICAEPQGQKYVAATEWNIIIVNHLWLEESYRAWQVQSVTRPHYTHFPVGSSLLEIVGQTGYRPIDLEPWRVKARTHQIDEASDAVVEHPAAADTITEIPPSIKRTIISIMAILETVQLSATSIGIRGKCSLIRSCTIDE